MYFEDVVEILQASAYFLMVILLIGFIGWAGYRIYHPLVTTGTYFCTKAKITKATVCYDPVTHEYLNFIYKDHLPNQNGEDR